MSEDPSTSSMPPIRRGMTRKRDTARALAKNVLHVTPLAIVGILFVVFVLDEQIRQRAGVYFGSGAPFLPSVYAPSSGFPNVTVAPVWPNLADSFYVDSTFIDFPLSLSPYFWAFFLTYVFGIFAVLPMFRLKTKHAPAMIALGCAAIALVVLQTGMYSAYEKIFAEDGNMKSEKATKLRGLSG
jgi:hypothetical protein